MEWRDSELEGEGREFLLFTPSVSKFEHQKVFKIYI
jgi:hypothetical protein